MALELGLRHLPHEEVSARRRPDPDDAIRTEGLVKSFGPVRALDALDLRVRVGEIHGFLGPNGAGKTTTLRILLGLLRAEGGSTTVLGADPWTEATTLHRRLAYVPGEVTLWPNLSGGEVIDLLGRLRGGIDTERRDEMIARFELDPSRKCRTYSKGNRQKVALVEALASDAELLLLDEPTSGLDPLMEQEFRAAVGQLRDAGRTVLLSSHILAEVEALCDRVTIIRAGRTVDSGSLSELRHLTRTSVEADLVGSVAGLDRISGVDHLTVHDGHVRFNVDPSGLQAAIAALVAAGITALTVHPPTLEELFLGHYRGPDEGGSGP